MKLNRIIITLTLIITGTAASYAQLYPLGAMYYQNQYLGNPALTGFGPKLAPGGLQLNGVFREQWSSMPGTPVNQSVTAQYRLKEKVGLGLNFYNDEAGLMKTTKAAASYAYHLPLNETGSALHLGISLGLMFDRIMDEDVNSDLHDPSVARFNQREKYVDGDFGIAYTSENLSIQAALPNLKQTFKRDDLETADRPTFFTAVSYHLRFGDDLDRVSLTPKLVYRGVSGHENLVDAGANVSFVNDRVNLMGMYHSNRNATFGLGLNYKDLSFLGMFTTATAQLRGYAHGNFEVGIGYNIQRK